MPRLFSGGIEWPHGTFTKTLSTDFDGGVIPPWLTVAGGATTSESVDSGQGGASGIGGLAITGSNNKSVQGEPIDLSDPWLAAVKIAVTLTPSADGIGGNVRIGFIGTDAGGWIRQGGGNNPATLQAQAGTTTSEISPPGFQIREVPGVRVNVALTLVAHDMLGREVKELQPEVVGGRFREHAFGSEMDLGEVIPQITWGGTPADRIDHIHRLTIIKEWI